MIKFFAAIDICVGCNTCYTFYAEDQDGAETFARELAKDFASDYGYDSDPDAFGGCYDSLGKDWNESTGEYEDEAFLEYVVSEYDPEEHDCESPEHMEE